MGYTHYWDDCEKDQATWNNRFMPCAKSILRHCGASLHFEHNEPDKPARLSKKQIRFNGYEDDGHETFCINRIPRPNDWAWCKTARKPYDTAVVAILMLLDYVFEDFSWSSDGEDEDHESARELFMSLRYLADGPTIEALEVGPPLDDPALIDDDPGL